MQNKMETQIDERLTEDSKEGSNEQAPSQIIEVKESIKLQKNSRGYNYESRLIAKEGTDLLDQLDYVHDQIEKKIKKWESKK